MNRLYVVFTILLFAGVSVFGQRTTQPGVRISGTHTPGNVAVFGDSGRTLVDGGVGPTNVVYGTNVMARIDTNTLNIATNAADVASLKMQMINVMDYGAVGDAGHVCADYAGVYGVNMTAGSAVLTKNSGDLFSVDDVGKAIFVRGAGVAGATLKTTIATYTSPNEVVLAATASTTVTTVDAAWGSDDTAAVQAAVNAAAAATNGSMTVYFPSGKKYLCNIDLPNVVSLQGGGAESWRYPVATVEVNGATLLPWDEDLPLVDMYADSAYNTNRVCNNAIENIRLQGYSYTGAAGIDIHHNGANDSFTGHGLTVYRCGINTFSTGIHNEGSIGLSVRDCALYHNTTNFFQNGEAPSTTFDNNIIACPAKDGSICYAFYVTRGVELNINGLDCGQDMHHIGYFDNCVVNLESFNFEMFTGSTEGDWAIFSLNAVMSISTGRFMRGGSGSSTIRFIRSRGAASRIILDNIKVLDIGDSPHTGRPYFFETDERSYWPDIRQCSTSVDVGYTLERYSDSTFTTLVEVNTTDWITRDQTFIRYPALNRKVLNENFIGGGLTSGIIGELGWDTTSGTISKEASSNYGGEIVMSTAASIGSVANIHLSGTNSYPFADLESAAHIPWEITFALRNTSALPFTSTSFIGLMGGISTSSASPEYFCGLTYNNVDASVWQFEIHGPGGADTINTAVNGSAGWDTLFRMRCLKAGEIRFRINDDPEEVIATTQFEGERYTIGAAIEAQVGDVKSLNVDRMIYDCKYNAHDYQ